MNDSSRWQTHRRYLYLLAKIVFFGLFIAGGVWLFGRLSNILLPLGISFLIAYLMDPLVDWFEERGLNRTLSIFVLMLLVLSSLTVFVLVITPTLIDEIQSVAKKFPALTKAIREYYLELQIELRTRFDYELPATISDTFANYGQKIEELASEALQKVTELTGQVLSGTFAAITYLLNVLLVPLFVFYYLRDFDRIKLEILELVPLTFRPTVVARAKRVDSVVGHWFRGQVTVATILAVLYSVGLALCGLKLGIAIGILAGFLSVVPYLGFIIGIGLAMLMSALDDGTGWSQFFGVLAVFAIIQTLEGYLITPKIVGEKVGLSPLMVIIVLLVGAELFGFLGIILAIPAAAVIRVFMLEAISDYKRSRFFLGEDKFLMLLATGAEGAPAEVREALKQATEAELDIALPDPLTTAELDRIKGEPEVVEPPSDDDGPPPEA